MSIQSEISPEEWAVRKDLAAAYQLAFLHRMTDHIYTHISARVPGDEAHFLINAYGLTFDEITPESLVKVDLEGRIILDETRLGINPAGYVIHSAIHGVRHDAACVMHTHTAAGVAVSAQERGLLMLSQHAMRFHERLSYHDYEGVALDLDEQKRLIADLGSTNAMILRNHGLLVCGADVADAFDAMYYLERACQIQVHALAGGMKIIEPSAAVAEKVARQFDKSDRPSRAKQWPAMLRMLERNKPRLGA
ncbi:class II aldolase/adducin family protein [Pollutimonas harenae]|uniref:Class II aldolase/adducin family protein n=1 Tax=Pollutimonas harenae TaxID=657015 RepID=A0A853GZF7_9BURK|nr:class II aldolase/adducin family protein [Pollutimonas harenae]NYT84435.1 class II aldolase/adducin family protein [Pollutimonas harenae]TEA73164.1 class II aldolase/adducin family protein [Pollutimonas harenae]